MVTKLKKKQKFDKNQDELDTSKESKPKGRSYTISIALPGSVLENAQSPALRSNLAGQVFNA